MQLSKYQNELYSQLKIAIKSRKVSKFVYRSEWLGYFPFGQYHWIEIDGDEIQLQQTDSIYVDLQALEKAMLIEKVSETETEDNIYIAFAIADE
ncbi:hypothetical protein [Pseudoalteromonas galatheae]|uniref:hypothetical protein n=1 Tax=Pseudoalteromonas galatheae TaxID=579562 RepID=UPI0030D5D025